MIVEDLLQEIERIKERERRHIALKMKYADIISDLKGTIDEQQGKIDHLEYILTQFMEGNQGKGSINQE
jgi:hypothetical protein